MHDFQQDRFDGLRELAEPIAKKRAMNAETAQVQNISKLISEIRVFQAELGGRSRTKS